MKTITITIQVPDGVAVNVGGAPANTGNDRPFVPRDAPPQPPGGCPVHDLAWSLVPAGVSNKTGKPYNAFYACPDRGCDERPPRGVAAGVTDITNYGEDGLPF